MDNKLKNIIISDGRLPLWSKILGYICLVGGGALCYRAFVQHDFSTFILMAVLTVNFVFISWLVIYIKFDIAGRRFKKEYTFGVIRFGIWKHLPQIDYISVFRQAWSADSDGDGVNEVKGFKYDVNVWYNGTKHFTIYSDRDMGQCYAVAMRMAVRLDIDLLDATVPNDHKWIELPVKDVPV